MATITDIADAVKDELNGNLFSQEFTAERHYLPFFDLAGMKTLRVTVMPRDIDMASGTRISTQHDYKVDVAIQKKVTTTNNAEIDMLMTFVEEIADFLTRRQLAGQPDAIWVNVANKPVLVADHLAEYGQFTSILTLTYRKIS